MFDRRLVQYFDWGLLGLVVLIGCIGLATLYSAVTAETPAPQTMIFYKQLVWFAVGMGAMMVAFLFNYKLLQIAGSMVPCDLCHMYYSFDRCDFSGKIYRRLKTMADSRTDIHSAFRIG
jgi:hypothetical protein